VSFVSPSLLWLLAPLAGILIVLYLLKMRRKDFRVPATFLWPHQTFEIRANSLFQKLKFSWLLLLQLIALALTVFALARPQIRSSTLTGNVTVIVIDTSASMSATDVKPSRLAEAVKAANKVVDSARPGDKVSLIEAGPTPRVLSPLSNDVGRMRIALSSVKATDASSDVGEALRLASSLVSRENSSRIILLSDGVFPDITDFAPGKAEVVFNRIGNSDQNTAVSALGISDTSQGPEIYCSLKNYGRILDAGVLDIYIDSQLTASRKLQVPPHGANGQTFPAPSGAKVIEAKFKNQDFLQADNYAVALHGAATLNVLLVGKGDLFLERALSLDPRVALYKTPNAPNAQRRTPNTQNYDIVVFDNTPETPVNALGVLNLGAAGVNTPVIAHGRIDKPVPTTVKEGALTKGVTFESTFISTAQKVTPAAGAEVLAQSKDGPLLIASRGAQKHVYLAFSPLDSDFPLQVSFPIFISNALDYLAPKEVTNSDLAIAAGRNIAIPAQNRDLTIKGPNETLNVAASNGQYVLRDLNQVGKYEIESPRKRNLYVTFGDESESDIAPVDRVLLGHTSVKASPSIERLSDWWKPLAVLALLVLAVEWCVYMWRS